MTDVVIEKKRTLKATEAILEYLYQDIERVGFTGLANGISGLRQYCIDLLSTLPECEGDNKVMPLLTLFTNRTGGPLQ